jgi:hypothetical protein
MSDTEIADARVDQLEARRTEHEKWVEQISSTDPGGRLPPAQAQEARQAQLREIEAHVSESERLSTAAELRAAQEREASGIARTLRRSMLRKAAAGDEDKQKFLAELAEAQLSNQREREVRRRIADPSEKRRHPPDPRARSVAAALFSDPFLADAVELRLRDDLIVIEDGRERRLPQGKFMKVRVLEPEDLVVLFAVGLTIEAGKLLRLNEPDRGLGTLSNVPASLARLQRNGLVTAERNGNAWVVGWGVRALRIAREAGVPIATE